MRASRDGEMVPTWNWHRAKFSDHPLRYTLLAMAVAVVLGLLFAQSITTAVVAAMVVAVVYSVFYLKARRNGGRLPDLKSYSFDNSTEPQ